MQWLFVLIGLIHLQQVISTGIFLIRYFLDSFNINNKNDLNVSTGHKIDLCFYTDYALTSRVPIEGK